MVSTTTNLPRGLSKGTEVLHTVTHHDPSIVLQKGNTSADSTLGGYYIDLTPSLVNYTRQWYGDFDSDGVPKVGFGSLARYHPINIAQYGFIVHDLWLADPREDYLEVLKNLLKWFEANKKPFRDATVWPQYYDDKYDIPDGWVSGMAIGEILSFYLRIYQALGDPHLLDVSKSIYNCFSIDCEDGGVRRFDRDKNLWFEEFQSRKPSFVLNGFIYAVFGVFDFYRVTRDPEVKAVFDSCVSTLERSLNKYDCGYWSLYDQLKSELVSPYYQRNVHIPQMDAMYSLTGLDIFKHYRDKWARQLNPANIMLVAVMMRIRPRWQRLKRRLNFGGIA